MVHLHELSEGTEDITVISGAEHSNAMAQADLDINEDPWDRKLVLTLGEKAHPQC